MQRYHTLAKNEQWFCAAKVLSRPCLSWVKTSNAQNKEMFSGLPLKADLSA
jgi:hypothetical protein